MIFTGLSTTLFAVTLADIIGLKDLTIAFGMTIALHGVAMLLGPACEGNHYRAMGILWLCTCLSIPFSANFCLWLDFSFPPKSPQNLRSH